MAKPKTPGNPRVKKTPEKAAEKRGHTTVLEQTAGAWPYPLPVPWPEPIPLDLGVSGTYTWSPWVIQPTWPTRWPISRAHGDGNGAAQDLATPTRDPQVARAPWGPGPIFPFVVGEELRLDVDRSHPQMTASGTLRYLGASSVHWIAALTSTGSFWAPRYEGDVWYVGPDGATFTYDHVEIDVNRTSWSPSTATVVFTSSSGSTRTRTFSYKEPTFHDVTFEYDCETGVDPTLSIGTCDHPNRPSDLTCRTLTIADVFREAGFDVSSSSGDGTVPSGLAGSNGAWSDMELHDAMESYWSHFADAPQWSSWTFVGAIHEDGSGLGGIMFDDIGDEHRQGCAVFQDSFISEAPAGDPDPDAWVARMQFWTVVHEMGHTFNLAHSWQKSLGAPYGSSWIPLADEDEARSFMNYPYYVSGGTDAFFDDFYYEFSDSELVFMRHAPAEYVQQGNAAWFDHHGFQHLEPFTSKDLQLVVRANRARADFEFLEPIVLELKLKNVSTRPVVVDGNLLRTGEGLTLVTKREGRPARQFAPYARHCLVPDLKVLAPGEAIYAPLFLSADRFGWLLDEPGRYAVQAALQIGPKAAVSRALNLRIRPEASFDEKRIAQDYFSAEVGRVLTFDGSHVLKSGVETLRELRAVLPESKAAIHAAVALANGAVREARVLELPTAGAGLRRAEDAGGRFRRVKPDLDEANALVVEALSADGDRSAESLGHIDFNEYGQRFAALLSQAGLEATRHELEKTCLDTLKQRGVPKRILGGLERTWSDVK